MTQAAKVVLVDQDDNYLMLYRNQHPTLGNDPDIPGGTVEDGELVIDGLVREVREEIGLEIDAAQLEELYSGRSYEGLHLHHSLFVLPIADRPELAISWEHASYEWLPRQEFLQLSAGANDSYMHMVHDVLTGKLGDQSAACVL